MSKYFLGKLLTKAIKAVPRSKKVSPTIKSVKPTTDISGSVKRTKKDEFRKRYTALDKAEGKLKTGKKMMKEGQKIRKGMKDTGTAFKFKGSKSYHALEPGDKKKYKIKKGVARGD